MAIASTDPEPAVPSIILAVVRAPTEQLSDLERQMRKNDMTILKKRALELNMDEIRTWFSEQPSDDPQIETMGYVLQGYDVSIVWTNMTQEIGPNICGQAPDDIFREEFPSVVVDNYLLQPTWTREYLEQLKPTLIAGLREICSKKPEDPTQYLADYLRQNKA